MPDAGPDGDRRVRLRPVQAGEHLLDEDSNSPLFSLLCTLLPLSSQLYFLSHLQCPSPLPPLSFLLPTPHLRSHSPLSANLCKQGCTIEFGAAPPTAASAPHWETLSIAQIAQAECTLISGEGAFLSLPFAASQMSGERRAEKNERRNERQGEIKCQRRGNAAKGRERSALFAFPGADGAET